MPSLMEILKSLGVDNPAEATDEQLERASEIMREEQARRWTEENTRKWGLRGKTPEEQRKIDEETSRVKGEGGENKG